MKKLFLLKTKFENRFHDLVFYQVLQPYIEWSFLKTFKNVFPDQIFNICRY